MSLRIPVLLAVAALGTAPVASAVTASSNAPMRVGVNVVPAASQCSNNPGPFISLEGSITLGGLNARLRFSNNLKGTHQRSEDIVTSVELVSDEPIHFAKQPPEGGVGGNPHIFLQFTTGDGTPIGSEIYLGRCVQLGN